MPRPPRYLPRPGLLVEITQRTIQGRYLLRPGRRANLLIVGVLARAQEETGLQVHAISVLSNHLHLLASPTTVEQVARFMHYVKTNLSKEIGRIHDWRGPMFDRRYTMIAVSDEEEAQTRRLRYLLAQGCKEGLVESPLDWPGVHCAKQMLRGEGLRGLWVDRVRLWAARQRKESAEPSEFETETELQLVPLPCWEHFAVERQQKRLAELIEEIEREAAAMHRDRGTEPLGARITCRHHPHRRPGGLERSPRPTFHTHRKRVWDAMRFAWGEFLAAYRTASEKLRNRGSPPGFPENCFPTRGEFVKPEHSRSSHNVPGTL